MVFFLLLNSYDPILFSSIFLITAYVILCRVVFAFGGTIKETIQDITPTTLTTGVLSTLRTVDNNAHKVLHDTGTYNTDWGNTHINAHDSNTLSAYI